LVEIICYINEKLKIPDIKFIIAGSGPLEEAIKRLAEKYRNVHYLGFITPETLPNIYRSAHLFLIPSKMEGMPLSLLEAQSCGLPAVGSNVPGVLDVIVNGKTGRLINLGDVEGYANAIKDYYKLWCSSPHKYRELSRYIREYIVNNYDWNTVVSKLEKMFKETFMVKLTR
jgi:glycosyltransferase involved in cell wall biosynthesis